MGAFVRGTILGETSCAATRVCIVVVSFFYVILPPRFWIICPPTWLLDPIITRAHDAFSAFFCFAGGEAVGIIGAGRTKAGKKAARAVGYHHTGSFVVAVWFVLFEKLCVCVFFSLSLHVYELYSMYPFFCSCPIETCSLRYTLRTPLSPPKCMIYVRVVVVAWCRCFRQVSVDFEGGGGGRYAGGKIFW